MTLADTPTPQLLAMRARLRVDVRVQWAKYDDARGTKPHIALVQIDRRLVRLENELTAVEQALAERGASS